MDWNMLEFNSRSKLSEFHTEKNSGPYAGPMKSKKKSKSAPVWSARIRARLKDLNWSIPTLAEKMGHKNDSGFLDRLYKIVQGKVDNPRGTLLGDIGKAIGLSERELRYGDDHLSSESIAAGDEPNDYDDTPRKPTEGIQEWDIRAGMGGGGTAEGREVRHDGDHSDPVKPEAWHFPREFLREELRLAATRIAILETQGDSMTPTLNSGDRVVVDTGHRVPSPDGIYAIRDQYGYIVVKRLQTLRRGDPPTIRIISDNKSHDAEDVSADDIAIVGRVLWGLKRL